MNGFTIPATATSLTVAITSFTATDNVGVTGYLVTQSSTTPSASATGWSATAPNSYTAGATGTVTLYAWAKDAAGNVSASRSASVTITISTGGGSGGTVGTGATGISGVVKDIATGAIISGALVSDGTRSTTTGSSGTYTLGEAAGSYTLTITKSGYLTTQQVAAVTAGATKTVNWALTRSYGTQAIPATGMSYVIFAWNDLGMHCDQDDYSYFMVLPPYNTLKAQVFRRGSEGASLITSGITVNYSFPKKKNSALHTNFWAYAPQFGFNVPTNVGISGTPLAGTMKLAADGQSWEAVGIPITPYDDDGTWDPYGTAVVTVNNSSGSTLQTVNVVAPVSTEMMCSNCHGTVNPQLDILQKHDSAMGTAFVADRSNGKVHACSECHPDNALGAAGKPGMPSLSLAMHSFHQDKMSVADQTTTAGCYNCHPGPKTQCLRGVMARAGKTCADCHGDMAALTTSVQNGRRPWLDMPKCGDCHGTSHAENANTLYRFSKLTNSPVSGMNGRIYCEACHNSTHAELITANAADPTIPGKFQGDNYWIWNCAVCHGSSSSGTMHRGGASTAGTSTGGTIIGGHDFNGDGKPDILWRNPQTGENVVWYMNGANLTSFVYLTPVPPPWQIVGAGDFNGDGKPDILWRNTATGENVVWYMNGANVTSSVYAQPPFPLNWQIVGAGDFNGDGKPDILWRNTADGPECGLVHEWGERDFLCLCSPPFRPHLADRGDW